MTDDEVVSYRLDKIEDDIKEMRQGILGLERIATASRFDQQEVARLNEAVKTLGKKLDYIRDEMPSLRLVKTLVFSVIGAFTTALGGVLLWLVQGGN